MIFLDQRFLTLNCQGTSIQKYEYFSFKHKMRSIIKFFRFLNEAALFSPISSFICFLHVSACMRALTFRQFSRLFYTTIRSCSTCLADHNFLIFLNLTQISIRYGQCCLRRSSWLKNVEPPQFNFLQFYYFIGEKCSHKIPAKQMAYLLIRIRKRQKLISSLFSQKVGLFPKRFSGLLIKLNEIVGLPSRIDLLTLKFCQNIFYNHFQGLLLEKQVYKNKTFKIFKLRSEICTIIAKKGWSIINLGFQNAFINVELPFFLKILMKMLEHLV